MWSLLTSHFKFWMTNFSKGPVVFHEYTCIAIEIGPPECIVAPEQSDESKQALDVNAMHYKVVKNSETHIERRIKVENKGAKQSPHD